MSRHRRLLLTIWCLLLRPLGYPVPVKCIEYLEVMQLVVEPSVLPLRSTLFVDDYSLMLSVILKVGLIAICTLVLLQRLSYLLMMPVC